MAILTETSITLVMLRDWLREQQNINVAIEENIKNMLQENTSTILDIQALDMSEAMQAFKSFSDRNLLKKVS